MFKISHKTFLFTLCLLFVSAAEEALTWEKCVREALKRHPDLTAAREGVVQSKADKNISISNILPQISAQLNGKKSKTAAGSKANSYSHTLSGEQLIFDGLKTASDINAAAKTLSAKEYNYMAVSSLPERLIRQEPFEMAAGRGGFF